MQIADYFGQWCKVLDIREAERVTRTLAGKPLCPVLGDIFKAFRLCSLEDLRIVVLGQDPYPDIKGGKPVATGIAFANSSDTPEESFSPSLEILRESIIDFTRPHGLVNFDPSLEKLEEQGVLFLNSALTCIPGKPGSHALLWRPLIKSLLSNLSRYTTGIVYILMGNTAQSFESCIYGNNHIIKTRHPAYYARINGRMPSDIWRQADSILDMQNGYKIKWYEEY